MHPFRTGLRRKLLSVAIANACAATLFVAPAALAQDTNLQPNESSDTSTTLPTLQVTESRLYEEATGPVDGYVATRSATATKTDTSIAETPRSITVVTRQQMRDQAARTVEEAISYTATQPELTGDQRRQLISVRGFEAESYVDGLKIPRRFGTYAQWENDPQGLERVEVLKGPAAVLYGQGTPGGIVNQVSKRPTNDARREVSATLGNNDLYQATFDVNDQLTDNGTILFRINGLARESGTETNFSDDDRLYLSPALTWQPNEQTSWTLMGHLTRDRATPKAWWPNNTLISNNPNGRITIHDFPGEPDFDYIERDAQSVTSLFEHSFNENITFRQNARYLDVDFEYQHVYATSWIDDRTLGRGALTNNASGNAFTVDNHMQFDFNTSVIEHKLVSGIDYQRVNGKEDIGFGTAPPLDAFDPQYGASVPNPETEHNTNRHRQIGVYLQDQLRIGSWIANFGIRHDEADTTITNGGTNFGLDDELVVDLNQSKTTYNAALMYQFDNGISPYVSYATSFNPVYSGLTFDGSPLKPETADQLEAGLKYQPPGRTALFTASVFSLEQKNVLTPDLENTGYSEQTGEVRSRGFELEAKAPITDQLDFLAAYTYLDTEIIKSNRGDEGNTQAGTPKHMAAAWLNYQFDSETLPGWSVGAGVRYSSETFTNNANSHENPSYALFDTALRYETGPISYAFNARNVFDEEVITSAGRFFGPGRTFQATASYRW